MYTFYVLFMFLDIYTERQQKHAPPYIILLVIGMLHLLHCHRYNILGAQRIYIFFNEWISSA